MLSNLHVGSVPREGRTILATNSTKTIRSPFNKTLINHKHLTPKLHHRQASTILKVSAAEQQAETTTTTAATEKTSTKTSSPPTPPTISSWPCKSGHLVQILQSTENDINTVHITLTPANNPLKPHQEPQLHWGIFRTSAQTWQHPEAVIPANSSLDKETGAMRSPMTLNADGTYSAVLNVPAKFAPISVAFSIYAPTSTNKKSSSSLTALTNTADDKDYISPLQGRHFTALIGMQGGSPTPLGPSIVHPTPTTTTSKTTKKSKSNNNTAAASSTINFAVRVMGADNVHLVLLKPPSPDSTDPKWGTLEIALDPAINRTGHTWHVAVSGLKGLDTLCFGWRVDGDVSWDKGYRIQPDQLLLDPSAPLLQYLPAESVGKVPLPLPTINGGGDGGEKSFVVLSSLASLFEQNKGSWQKDGGGRCERGRALEDVRAMEIDVRTFAQGSKVKHPGTYLGVAERIDHIKAVGVNTVVISPMYATAPGAQGSGHAAVSLLSPDPLLSTNPTNPNTAATELHQMVDALHAAGIEVVAEIDLTFTAEGTDDEPNILGMRGLDYTAYYRPNGVLNCGHPAVHSMVVHALKQWACDYGMDGFCFINAENMVQDRDGFVLDAPPLVDSISFDPVLSSLKLIAASNSQELLPRGGMRGFPHWGLWQQRNTAFARDLMAYTCEGTFLLNTIATRLTGSADMFDAQMNGDVPGNLGAGRRPSFSFNSISALGSKSNLKEVTGKAARLAAAAAAAEHSGQHSASPITLGKTLLAAAVLAQGVPFITQDDVADTEFARFVGIVMRLRRKFSDLLQPVLFASPREMQWLASSGHEPEWGACSLDAVAAEGSHLSGCNYLAFTVKNVDSDEEDGGNGTSGSSAVYVGINPHPHQVMANLPAAPEGKTWAMAVDTALAAPDDAALDEYIAVEGNLYGVNPKALIVLIAV